MSAHDPHEIDIDPGDRDATLSFCWSTSGEEGSKTLSASPFNVGEVLGERYLLQALLGRGRMGQVYLAKDKRLQRQVALKVIINAFDPDSAREKFEKEAQLGASLQHPSIAVVLDYGFSQGFPFTVFEYVDGQSLRYLIHSRKDFRLEEVRSIVAQLAQALDYAHTRGIVHRDLKPENVSSTQSGQFKILDLGLARNFVYDLYPTSYSGTPSYSSPEQAACQPIDGRSDQYSLALICFEMLTGKRPFQASKVAEMLLHQIRTPAPDPRQYREDLPDSVVLALQRALAKNPAERFPTCQAFAAAIGEVGVGPAAPILGVAEDRQIGFYLCHAPDNSILARQLAQSLETEGLSCWLYQRDALPGISLKQQVAEVLARCQAGIILISQALLKSKTLIEEIGQLHRQGRILFPLLVDLTQEEFEAQRHPWRSMLGPSVLLSFEQLEQLDEHVQRIVESAQTLGLSRHKVNAPVPLPPTKGAMLSRIWATDANQIDIVDLDRVVFRTEVVEDFLQRRNKYFLSASKGLGKTLLLTCKRHRLSQEGGAKANRLLLIPEGRPYLDFMSELRTLSDRYTKPLSEIGTTKRFWGAALRISILSHHEHWLEKEEKSEVERFPPRIQRWLMGGRTQPTVVFKELTSLGISELNRLIDDTENFLDEKSRKVHGATCLFVDKVDQAVRHLPRAAWINVQAGLIEAAWELMNANSHFRIYATIREEAFVNYESDVKSNLFGATTRIQYTEAELASMLDQLTQCYEGVRSFRDFVGMNVVRHAQRPDPEDTFHFMRRHTFGRPRDLVAMSSEFSAKKGSLSEERFRASVYETASTSLVSNVFDEVQVFMTCLGDREDRLRFLASIPQNILSRPEAIEVSERFNGLDPGSIESLGEDSKYIHHPFRDLYLAGLLGVIGRDPESGQETQRFRQPNDMLQDVSFELPESKYYLIHPGLNHFIAQQRTQADYLLFQQIRIGHGEPWADFYGLFCEAEKQIALLGTEEATSAHRLLAQAHTQLKSKRERITDVFSTSNPDWQQLQHAAPKTDELVYWLGELSELSVE